MTVQLVRMAAKEIAGAYYDLERSPQFRKNFPDQRLYVRLRWPHFVEEARKQLSGMLGNSMTPDHQKREIYEALIEDKRRQDTARARDLRTLHQADLEPVED